MKEEREIYIKVFNEFKAYFQKKLKVKFNSIEVQIKHHCTTIIKSINQIMKLFRKKELEKEKKEIKNKIEKIIYLNILIIGNTGVGKSTLINEFLKLENNKSEEGKGHKPMKIDSWPKKYPINEDDSPIKNINLYDTEGIEKSCKDGNDINSHFLKVKKFLEDKNNKINALWYCVNGNRLDGEEEYIDKTLSLNELKIPIIFIYTKAYSNKEEEIDTIKEGLKELDYFKKNEDKFHFIEVISRDYINKKGETKEKSKGLKELLDLTISLSENSFKYQFYKVINEYYNKKAEFFINDLSSHLKEQFSNIITKKENDDDIFKKYINDIFNCSYGDYLKVKKNEIIGNYSETPLCSENENENEIDITYKSVEKMLKIFEITKENLEEAIKSFDKKKDLSKKVKNFIKYKYEEKKTKSQTFNEFNDCIEDYIISPFDDSKDIYGAYFLFDMLRDIILHEIIVNLNKDLMQKKLDATAELKSLIIENINEFKKKFN